MEHVSSRHHGHVERLPASTPDLVHLLTDVVVKPLDGHSIQCIKLQAEVKELAKHAPRHAIANAQRCDSDIERPHDHVKSGPEMPVVDDVLDLLSGLLHLRRLLLQPRLVVVVSQKGFIQFATRKHATSHHDLGSKTCFAILEQLIALLPERVANWQSFDKSAIASKGLVVVGDKLDHKPNVVEGVGEESDAPLYMLSLDA
mmetsp:Transcript_48359/g.117680  ORF Transcript_48359/g.117680 Transcript_48359/m.117680 type:complete len:201 (-) Transcript_48359:405-1007(-)